MLLNKQQIKDAKDLPTKIISMEEWGGDIKIQMMSGERRMEYEKLANKSKLPIDNILLLIIFSCVNEDGSLFFSVEDKEFLAKKSSDSLVKLFNEAVNLSVVSDKALEDRAKNS